MPSSGRSTRAQRNTSKYVALRSKPATSPKEWYRTPGTSRIRYSITSSQNTSTVTSPIYNIAIAATAAAPKPKNDCELRPAATLAVACAGPDPVPLASFPPAVPEPLEGEGGVFPPALPPEPGAWPGLKFSVAEAARATKASMVRLPAAGLLYVSSGTNLEVVLI